MEKQKRRTTHPDRTRRQEDAATRQASRDARTAEQQLAQISRRPGHSMRERERLIELCRSAGGDS